MKRQRTRMFPTRRRTARRDGTTGMTLVELLVAIAVMAILAGVVVSRFQSNVREGLMGTARIVVADLDRARELAVSGGSTYRITFDLDANAYWLEHTGANASLDPLPPAPWGTFNATGTRWTQRLDAIPQIGLPIRLHAVRRGTGGASSVNSVEFGPLGETTEPEPTVVWLASGQGTACRYLSISINPVTGITSIGDFRAAPP